MVFPIHAPIDQFPEGTEFYGNVANFGVNHSRNHGALDELSGFPPKF